MGILVNFSHVVAVVAEVLPLLVMPEQKKNKQKLRPKKNLNKKKKRKMLIWEDYLIEKYIKEYMLIFFICCFGNNIFKKNVEFFILIVLNLWSCKVFENDIVFNFHSKYLRFYV